MYPNGTLVYSPNCAFDSFDDDKPAEEGLAYVVFNASGGRDTVTVCNKIFGKNDVIAGDDSYTSISEATTTARIVTNDADPFTGCSWG